MAGTTTNFGFDYPTSTDYVKDGATAIQTLADDVDARFGNVATYPNQIVNVVSGVSRPVPFAMYATQQASASIAGGAQGSVTITIPSGRFTQTPIPVISTNVGSTSTAHAYRTSASSTTSAGVTIQNGTGTAYVYTVNMLLIQMTSAASAG